MVIVETVYDMPCMMRRVSFWSREVDGQCGSKSEEMKKHTVSRPRLMEPTNLHMDTVACGIFVASRYSR